MPIFGYKELSEELKAMSTAASGAALKIAAREAIKPAVKAARAAAPVADPPYHYGAGVTHTAGGTVYGTGAVRTVDPYPHRTYLGRLVTPGFTRRNVATKITIDKTKTRVNAMIGVRPEAFYALQFIELGTSKFARRPWLEPSFRASIPAVDTKFREVLKALIDGAAKTGKSGAAGTGGDEE